MKIEKFANEDNKLSELVRNENYCIHVHAYRNRNRLLSHTYTDT